MSRPSVRPKPAHPACHVALKRGGATNGLVVLSEGLLYADDERTGGVAVEIHAAGSRL